MYQQTWTSSKIKFSRLRLQSFFPVTSPTEVRPTSSVCITVNAADTARQRRSVSARGSKDCLRGDCFIATTAETIADQFFWFPLLREWVQDGAPVSEVRLFYSLNIQCMGTNGFFRVMYDRVVSSVMGFCRTDFRDVFSCFDV